MPVTLARPSQDRTRTHLTVRVPLHVSYLFAAAPLGWTSLEHRTEMELAFYYSTVLWRTGLETEGRLGGKLQIKRILIGQDGKLVIEFRTQAKFRGLPFTSVDVFMVLLCVVIVVS